MQALAIVWFAAEPCPLVSDSGWLNQPTATVLAATIAVVAALIAYLGVIRTTSTTRRESRRQEKVEVLVEALAAIRSSAGEIAAIGKMVDPDERAAMVQELKKGGFGEIQDAVGLGNTKLMLYRFSDVLVTMDPLIDLISEAWVALRADPATTIDVDELGDALIQTLTAFRRALSDLK